MSPPDDTGTRHLATGHETLEAQDAARWLRDVDGRLMCKSDDPESPAGWVAIVRTPAATGRAGQLILGFGDSASTAVETARESWDKVWRELSSLH